MLKRRRYVNLGERLLQNSVNSKTHSFEGSPCWEFTGTKQAEGYGRITLWDKRLKKTVSHRAHRVAYTEWVGPIPEDHEVNHRCYNPPCINPKHLEAVPKKVNLAKRRKQMRDRAGKWQKT